MEVLNNSPSHFPALIGLCGLTNSPTTSTSPPSGLAPACQTSPSGHIPLGHNEKGSQTQATDSQITLVVAGGVIHNASTCTCPFNSLSRDSRGALGLTQPYLAPSVLEVRSFGPITATLVTYAARKCKHLLSLAHRGWFPPNPSRLPTHLHGHYAKEEAHLQTSHSLHRRDSAQPILSPREGEEPPTQKHHLSPP